MGWPANTTNMTDTTAVADNLILLWKKEFFISAQDELTKGLHSLVTQISNIAGKTESFTEYDKLTVQTSALTEDAAPTPIEMGDTAHTITPLEFGAVVQRTKLASLQTGGQVDNAAVALAVTNMRESMEKVLILRAEAGSNEITVGANEGATVAGDILTKTHVNRVFNKFKRTGIPRINGSYWCIAHDDVIHDLKQGTSTGDWVNVNQYENSMEVRSGEIGMYGGFRFISSPLVTINADAGNGTVDTYHTTFLGFNAFGYNTSLAPSLRIAEANDNLQRFLNIGWYGVYNYGIVDQAASYLVTSSSSIGSN